MKCTGIIAEYNPFHNGHAYHAEKARELSGCERVIAVMSGSFVQRGEPAMFDKHLRARLALLQGVDMVLELPAVFSLSCAERFAKGGVSILAATGLVDSLCFGSESANTERLFELARLMDSHDEALSALISQELAAGLPYPAALAAALERRSPGASELLGPNDMLAAEYLRALPEGMRAIAVKREGASHDSSLSQGGFASAGSIRKLMAEGADYTGFIPAAAKEALLSALAAGESRKMENLSQALLYALRNAAPESLAALPDISEGLENRLYAARRCATLTEALESVKTRRYTLARIKRALMCLLLGVTRQDTALLPYIRVLGVRKDAVSLLSALSERSALPVVTRFADSEALPQGAKRLHDIDMAAAELSYLACEKPTPARFDYASPLIMV